MIDSGKEATWLLRNPVDKECKNCVCFPLCMAQVCPQSRKLRDTKVCINEKEELKFYLRYLAKTKVFDKYVEI